MSKKRSISKITNNNYIELLMDRNLDIRNRTIYLWDRWDLEESTSNILDSSVSQEFLKALKLLECESHDPITVIINCSGGYVTDGYAIYDAIRSSPCHITAEVTGQCMSAATMALIACDNRRSHKSAVFMVHDGTSGAGGHTVRDAEAWVDYGKKERYRYYQIMSEATGKSVEFWENMCVNDKIFTPEDALNHGLISEIIPYKVKNGKENL